MRGPPADMAMKTAAILAYMPPRLAMVGGGASRAVGEARCVVAVVELGSRLWEYSWRAL